GAIRPVCEEYCPRRLWHLGPHPQTSHGAYLGAPASHGRIRPGRHVLERRHGRTHWGVFGRTTRGRPGHGGADLCCAGPIATAVLAGTDAHPPVWGHPGHFTGGWSGWPTASPVAGLYARVFYLCRHHAPDAF